MNIDASADLKRKVNGDFDMNRLRYQAKIQARNVQAKHFLPKQDLYAFTGNIEASGVGTDFLSSRTRLKAKAKVTSIHYGKYKIGNLLAVANIANGKIHADVDSKNDYFTGLVSLDALTHSKDIQATITADVRHTDLYRFQLTKVPMQAALCGHIDVNTDLNDNNNIQATW